MQAVFPGAPVRMCRIETTCDLQTHHHPEYAAMESQDRARPASSGSSTSAGSSRIATANTSGIVQIRNRSLINEMLCHE